MKVRSSRTIALLVLLTTITLSAQESENSLEDYISDLKQKQFKYDYEKNEAESSKLRDTWIAPINLSYTLNRTDSNPNTSEQETKSAVIRMDQPIFQSGGIYYGIKFANASRKYSNYSIDVAKRKMIKDAIALLMQIKQSDLKIKRQRLQIENSEIGLEQKREQYMSGQLDSSFLDNAIIELNIVTQNLYDIETAKERLISSFHTLSDLDYKTAKVPQLQLLSREDFLLDNIQLQMVEAQVERDRYSKNMTITQYLPAVNFTAGYTWTESSNQFIPSMNGLRKYYDYGFRATLPISINTFRDIESSRVDYLKSQVVKQDTVVKLDALFTQVLQNLDNLEKKRLLTVKNEELYSKLLKDTQELYAAGYKTEYDVSLLQNSLDIAKTDAKIYEIDKQLELLTLYEMYVNIQGN